MKKLVALLVCLTLVFSIGMSALAGNDTKDIEGVWQKTDGENQILYFHIYYDIASLNSSFVANVVYSHGHSHGIKIYEWKIYADPTISSRFIVITNYLDKSARELTVNSDGTITYDGSTYTRYQK